MKAGESRLAGLQLHSDRGRHYRGNLGLFRIAVVLSSPGVVSPEEVALAERTDYATGSYPLIGEHAVSMCGLHQVDFTEQIQR